MFDRLKHPFAGLSHWFGAILAVGGAGYLIATAAGNPLHVAAFAIYGFTLVFLYTASGLYHSCRPPERGERLLRNFDHVGIFLLIAGTYVPVCLIALAPAYGGVFLILQAVMALIGILGTFLLKRFPGALNVTLYLLMGWMALPAVGYMRAHWPPYATAWLLAGGIIYSIGAVIFALNKPDLWPGKFNAHDLWHVFVLAGSTCHFLLMVTYVAKVS